MARGLGHLGFLSGLLAIELGHSHGMACLRLFHFFLCLLGLCLGLLLLLLSLLLLSLCLAKLLRLFLLLRFSSLALLLSLFLLGLGLGLLLSPLLGLGLFFLFLRFSALLFTLLLSFNPKLLLTEHQLTASVMPGCAVRCRAYGLKELHHLLGTTRVVGLYRHVGLKNDSSDASGRTSHGMRSSVRSRSV